MINYISLSLAQVFFILACITGSRSLWYLFGLSMCGYLATIGASSFKNGLKKVWHADDMPTSKIRSAAQGCVELKGIIQPIPQQALLVSPLSNTPCLWFSFKIEQVEQSKNTESLTLLNSGHSDAHFCLIDDSGQCQINPKGASVTAHESTCWEGNTPHPQRQVRSLLQKLFFRRYRYSEQFLLPGEELYVLGFLHNRNGQSIVEKPPDGHPFILSRQKEHQFIRSNRNEVSYGVVMFCIAAILAGIIIWHWQR